MKFLDSIYSEHKRRSVKIRPKLCQWKKSCLPVSCFIGKNKAGFCSGIIHKSTNLDCIRHCVFFIDYERDKKLQCLSNFVTPDEALEIIHNLSLAVKATLQSSKHYLNSYKELRKARDKGDNSPANFNE